MIDNPFLSIESVLVKSGLRPSGGVFPGPT